MAFGGAAAAKRAAGIQADAAQAGIAEQRRQFDQTRSMLNPFVSAGTDALSSLTGGSSIGGFADRLNEIMNSPIFDKLRQSRTDAINTAMGKSGMFNSGARASAIGDDLTKFGLGLEDLLYGRSQNLAGTGLNAASGLGSFGQATAGNIGNLLTQQGQAQAGGVLGAQQAKAGLTSQLLGLGLGALGGGMAGSAGIEGFTGASGSPIGAGLGSLLGLTFSDARLKENIRKVGEIGPLNLYEWDWIPEVRHLDIPMKIGFLADEVEDLFPKYVHKVGPFKAVDYHGLLDQLDKVLH